MFTITNFIVGDLFSFAFYIPMIAFLYGQIPTLFIIMLISFYRYLNKEAIGSFIKSETLDFTC